MTSFHIPLWFGMLAMLAVFTLSLVRGDTEERSIISVMLVGWFVTYVTRDRSWPALQWGGLVADLVGFVLIFVIALRSRRFWPLYATAFQLLSLITSAAPLFDNSLRSWTLVTATVVWTYCMLGSIVWGCITRPPSATSGRSRAIENASKKIAKRFGRPPAWWRTQTS